MSPYGDALLAAGRHVGAVNWIGWARPSETDAELRQITEDVMSRDEFRHGPGWFERAMEWILEHLPKPNPGSTSPPGALGSVIVWVLLGLLLIAVVTVVIILVSRWLSGRTDDEDLDDELTDEVAVARLQPSEAWADESARHRAAGEWKLALRARYRQTIVRLIDRGALSDEPGRTPRELVADVAVARPEAEAPFDRASTLFEMVWYANVDADESSVDEMDRLAIELDRAVPRSRSLVGRS